MKDYYAILKISSNASQKEIRAAYRKLAQQIHPDKNIQVNSVLFAEITEAYHVVGNVGRRSTYDQERATIRAMTEKTRHKMTWMDGLHGFVTELKKELHEKD